MNTPVEVPGFKAAFAPIKKPECAHWRMWVGAEVEGEHDVGVRTLFIRSLKDVPGDFSELGTLQLLREKSQCSRVWFCHEFNHWRTVELATLAFDQVCIEARYCFAKSIPPRIRGRENVRIYYKVELDVPLRDGDVICVGRPFEDEAFTVGSGKRVTPDLYTNDRPVFR